MTSVYGMGHLGTSMQQEMLPGHMQRGLFLHHSEGWDCGWGLAGQESKQGEKPTKDGVVSMLVISCRWMATTCPAVSGEFGLK